MYYYFHFNKIHVKENLSLFLLSGETKTVGARRKVTWIFREKRNGKGNRGRDGFRRPEKGARQNRRERSDRRRSPRRMVWRYDKMYFLYASPHFHKYAKTVTVAGDIGTFTVFHRHYIPRKQSATTILPTPGTHF